MIEIERMRTIAEEAIKAYSNTSFGRGEAPPYPLWADDMLKVCQQAELWVRYGRSGPDKNPDRQEND